MNKEKLNIFLRNRSLTAPRVREEITANFTHKIVAKNQLFLTEGKIADGYLFF